MRAGALCASLLMGLAVAACAPNPKDFLEALNWEMDAQNKGEMTLALRHYTTAWEMADKVGNGSRAIYAADLAADAAFALGKDEDAFGLLDAALRGYSKEARQYVGRFRMPNNLAVLHVRKKNYAEARRLLERALTPWETLPMSPAFPFEAFAALSRNLLIVLAAQGWNAEAESWYGSVKEKVQSTVAFNRTSTQFTLGAGATLRALAALARTGPRPGEADELEALAAGAEASEAQFRQTHGWARGVCDEREVKGRKVRTCLLELP